MMSPTSASIIVGAAEFLVGSLLICLGILVIAGTVVLLNRLFTRYWQPLKMFNYAQAADVKKEPK
jgi:hypothetical protein